MLYITWWLTRVQTAFSNFILLYLDSKTDSFFSCGLSITVLFIISPLTISRSWHPLTCCQGLFLPCIILIYDCLCQFHLVWYTISSFCIPLPLLHATYEVHEIKLCILIYCSYECTIITGLVQFSVECCIRLHSDFISLCLLLCTVHSCAPYIVLSTHCFCCFLHHVHFLHPCSILLKIAIVIKKYCV